MVRKLVSLLLAVSCVFAVSSCSSFLEAMAGPEEIPPITVSDRMEAFAISTYYLDTKSYDIETFDYQKGTITTNYLEYNTGIAGTLKLRAKLVISFSSSHVLGVDFVNVQMYETKYSSNHSRVVGYYWKDAGFMGQEYVPVRNKIVMALDSLRSDKDALDACMNHFKSNFKYNYILLRSLTEVGRAKFIKENFIDRTYKWTLPLVDFRYNKNEKYAKKYVAHFRYDVSGGDDRAFGKLFKNTIYLNVYTDDGSLSESAKQESVNYSGVLVNIDETFTADDFNFDFFTVDGK
jgi:hypothetical protein